MGESDPTWEPFPVGVAPMYVEAVHDDYEGFRILLRGESLHSPMLRLSFDPPPLFYRVTEEGSWLNPDLPDELSGRKVLRFFAVAESELLRWFHRVSSGVRDWPNVRHYGVCMANQVVEVVACQPPKAENLNDG